MDGKCAKCGKQRNGDRYELYVARVTGERFNPIYSDLKTEHVFICDSCARMGKAGIYRAVLIIFGLMALPMLGAGFAAIGQQGVGAGVGGLIFGLILLAPAAWAAYTLITFRATRESGEFAAAGARFKALHAEGCVPIIESELKKLVPLHPELQSLLLKMQVQALGVQPGSGPMMQFDMTVSESDLQAVRAYTHHLAIEWRETQAADSAICDVCNQPVPRGYGNLIGSSLYCGQCAGGQFNDEGLNHLRRDPNFFGRGVLQQAREFAANRQAA
jgi:hypothetical protein